MKDNKLIEKYDDNPGAYFGMLVEGFEELHTYTVEYDDDSSGTVRHRMEEIKAKSVEEARDEFWRYHTDAHYPTAVYDENDADYTDMFYESLKEQKEVTREEKIKAISSNPKARKQAKEFTDKGELPFNSIVDFVYADFFGKEESLKEDKYFIVKSFYDGPHGFYGVIEDTSVIDNNGEGKKYRFHDREELEKFASELVSKGYKNQQGYTKDALLKEDKFVSRDKMSKKDRKELDSQKRNTWGNTNPVTRVQPNKKAYDRKRDKKIVDEEFVNSPLNKDSYNKFYSLIRDLGQVFYGMKEDVGMGDFSSRKEVSTMDAKFYSEKLSKISEELKKLSMTNN